MYISYPLSYCELCTVLSIYFYILNLILYKNLPKISVYNFVTFISFCAISSFMIDIYFSNYATSI